MPQIRRCSFNIQCPKTIKYLKSKGYDEKQIFNICNLVEEEYYAFDYLPDKKTPLEVVKDYEFVFGFPMFN